MRDRLKLSRQMEEKIAAEEEFSADMNTQDKSLRTKKTRILNEIVFPAMADLVFFFEAIASHEDLQVRFENDIKDLLGIKRNELQAYGFILLSLIRSILIIRDIERPRNKQDDFRLKLNHILQGIVFDKVRPSLIDVFKTSGSTDCCKR